jgi:hypothetical protein
MSQSFAPVALPARIAPEAAVGDEFSVRIYLNLVSRQDVGGRRNAPVFDDLDADQPAVLAALNAGDSLRFLAGELSDFAHSGARRLGGPEASATGAAALARPRGGCPLIVSVLVLADVV